jgi:hypothetical protein
MSSHDYFFSGARVALAIEYGLEDGKKVGEVTGDIHDSSCS